MMMPTDVNRVTAQNSAGVCNTCLSSDRALYSLKKTPECLNICNGLILSQYQMVCYECCARLKNIVRFRDCALQANRLLSCLPMHQWVSHDKGPDIECLSTLTQTVISPNDTIYMYDSLSEVKQEASDSELEVKEQVVKIEVLVKPMTYSGEDTLKDGHLSSDEEFLSSAKPDLGDDDDVKSDSASEGDKPQVERKKGQWQVQDSLITAHFTVKQLDPSELLAEMEAARGSAKYKAAQNKCDACAVTFRSEALRRAHSALHSEQRGASRCDVCQQRLKDEAALKQHTAAHYTRYLCRHCERVFPTYNQMYFHYKHAHDESPRPCGRCPASFTSKRELKLHRRREHGRVFPCPGCERQYATADGLQRHMLVHDKSVPQLECEYCHKKYKGEAKLKVHIQNVHQMKDGNAYCAECDLQFKTRNQYQNHLNSGRHVPLEDYRFECDYCGQRCVMKATLRTHIEQKHLKLRRYKCPLCDESFHTVWKRSRHKRLAHTALPPPEPHVCYICEKAFKRSKSLAEHMNTHLGVRPFACKLCTATFAWSAALYNHTQLVHLKKKRGKHKNP